MDPYRLSIVIPTHDRPGLLPHALDSALDQSVPARIIVSDNGDTARTASILKDRYAGPLHSGQVVHLESGKPEPWDNWRAGAEAADTDLVSWLQDDDIISRRYVERIVYGFDEARRLGADPHVWMARLQCADASGKFGMGFIGNGPWLPTQSLHDSCEPGHWRDGVPVAVSSYFTSWSLSPALAYRNGPRFRAALAAMPRLADIFVERIIPAEMAVEGGLIADGAVVGYWRQHDSNLSRKQHPDQPRQTRLLVQHLDGLLDRLPGWKRSFEAWCGAIPPMFLLNWLDQLDVTEKEGGKSRHGDAIRAILWGSLSGRIAITPMPLPRWRRAWDRLRSGARRLARGGPPGIAEIVEAHALPTDKCSTHSYGTWYDRALAPYRDRPVRLLEIGVFEGGSLRLWQEYFRRAQVVGVDPSPGPRAAAVAPAATIRRADAYDPAVAASLGEFDVVIDDGPHTLESQVAAVRLYAPRLRPGGVLVVEDVQDPGWFDPLERAVPAGYARERADLRHVKGRYDDLLLIVRAPA